jgi:septum formation protein
LIIDDLKKISNLILASASSRRRELLTEAGFKFKVVPPDIVEASLADENPRKFAERLALAKAKKVAEKFPESLVIGADTVVDFQGEIIGKPANAKEAEVITRKLFSGPHKVITGVALVRASAGVEIVESDSTTVYPKPLTDKEIQEHIKGGSWQDKAGAYAIQEGGDAFIEKIEGSLTNVMGLPMELLGRMMKQVSR